ncbi:TlpA family protein disulfide reductase [Salicibibacter cibarius]|uniref:TlpA family protein disulfide reductase n=2 Tax=Salicibibacter TaxID=2685905 RepID=A0A514LJC6_9BACI|nr:MULTISPECIES: TlpA disulfide reductase family protein [Salicibibacter]QDI91956.1 TlpA family protein disulfide reductase [Salicibibacter halophilus]QQK74491.1 TlpA family protein disulfide reductase [Salicibibacter cibarius]
MIRKVISIGALLIAVLVIGSVIYNTISSPPVGANQGEEAPDIELPQANGEDMTLSDLQGTFVIMNLWASWCEPCIREFPLLDQVHQEYSDDGVKVLAVNMTSFERTTDEAMEFLNDHPVTMPILFDMEGEVADAYQIEGLPTTYFINEEGIIVDTVVGEVTEDMIEERLEPFL